MKDAKQFVEDIKNDKELSEKFREELNRQRADESLEVWQAGRNAARSLGYELSEDDAKKIVKRKNGNGAEALTDDEAKAAAGGIICDVGSCNAPSFSCW